MSFSICQSASRSLAIPESDDIAYPNSKFTFLLQSMPAPNKVAKTQSRDFRQPFPHAIGKNKHVSSRFPPNGQNCPLWMRKKQKCVSSLGTIRRSLAKTRNCPGCTRTVQVGDRADRVVGQADRAGHPVMPGAVISPPLRDLSKRPAPSQIKTIPIFS